MEIESGQPIPPQVCTSLQLVEEKSAHFLGVGRTAVKYISVAH